MVFLRRRLRTHRQLSVQPVSHITQPVASPFSCLVSLRRFGMRRNCERKHSACHRVIKLELLIIQRLLRRQPPRQHCQAQLQFRSKRRVISSFWTISSSKGKPHLTNKGNNRPTFFFNKPSSRSSK